MKKPLIQKNITYKHKQNKSSSATRKQHLLMNVCRDDFYRCVNGQWLDRVKMPPYLSAFGISEEVEKRVETQLFSLVRTCKEPTICALAVSATRRHHSIETVKDLLNKINNIRDKNDVAATLGLLCKYKIGNLFSLEGRYYFKNGGQFTLHLDRGSIGLPNRKYYEQRTPFSHYKQFLDKVGAFFVQGLHVHAGGHGAQGIDEFTLEDLAQFLGMQGLAAETLGSLGDRFRVLFHADKELGFHIGTDAVEGDERLIIGPLHLEAEGHHVDGRDLLENGQHDGAPVRDDLLPAEARPDEGTFLAGSDIEP